MEDKLVRTVEIYETTNLDQFKALSGQPPERATKNMSKLALEMAKTKTNVVPIIVTSDRYVIDGNTRLEVCRACNYPVSYQVLAAGENEALKMMRTLNASNNPWTVDDYINFYSLGLKYEKFIELSRRLYDPDLGLKLSVFQALEPLAYTNQNIKSGDLGEVDLALLDARLEMVKNMKDLTKNYPTKAHLLARRYLYYSKQGVSDTAILYKLSVGWAEIASNKEKYYNLSDEATLIEVFRECMSMED